MPSPSSLPLVLPCNHNTMCASRHQCLVLWPLFPIQWLHCFEFMIIPWTHSVCPDIHPLPCMCVYILLYLLKSKIYIRPRTTPNVHTTPSLGTPISPSYYYNDYVDCLTSMWVHQCQTILIWTTLLSVETKW